MDNISPLQQKLITFTVMLVAIIEVLDTTIVNVVLPPMMGSLSANSEEVAWVLTSYIVSAAVVMPLTGYLTARLGQKRLLLINIIGFMLSSALCGFSHNLHEMVFFRVLQGIFGAALVPLSQVILRKSYKEEDYGSAMAIWGMGLMVAPVLGPTFGGFISEHLNWRWVFFINIPVCLGALILTFCVIKESPVEDRKTDWLGLFLMALSISALQLFLDKGNSLDWFSSNTIIILFVTAVFFGALFILRGLNISHNIVNIRLLNDKLFALSTLLISLFSGAMMGLVALQPMMLETVMHFGTELTGEVMAPRGLASAISMAIAASALKKGISPRALILFGLIISGCGTLLMAQFKISSPISTFAWVGALQGFGIGFFFVPLSSIAFQNLTESETAEAAGFFGFGRSIGSSIGISILTTLYTRQKQINFSLLSEHLQDDRLGLVANWLKQTNAPEKHQQALAYIYQQLQDNAMMNAFTNTFLTCGLIFLILLPLALLIKAKRLSA